MIKYESVSKGYAGEDLLEDISFKLNKGEKCGLVGRNGSGKTTLLRMTTGEEKPDKGLIEMPRGYKLGYLTQHLKFTHDTIVEEAASVLPPHESDQVYKVEKLLFGAGFKEEDLYSNPHDFSGGYQLRIHLVKVLAQEPDCLLLDEPTNYLDIVSIRWFTKFLKAWRGELMLISHDRDFMDSVTTHTLGVHRKKVRKFEGGTEKFYTHLLNEEQIQEKTRLNQEKKREKMETFITKLGAKASKATQAQSRAKQLAKMPVLEELAQLHNLNFKFPQAPFPGQRMLDISNCSFTYESMTEKLIPDFSLAVDKMDRIAIIGKNGRGKTTLLRLIAQDLEPLSGIFKSSSNLKTAFFGQTNIDRLDPNRTIEEEIGSVSRNLGVSEVRRICGIMMFSGDNAKKPIHVLSGGEKSRVLLGKILATPSNLLLLDEPTNHLDMESIEALVNAIEEYEGAVIIVTHSELILRQIPTKFVICHQGNQHLFTGDYDEFLAKEGWETEKIKLKGVKAEEVPQKKKEIIAPNKAIQPLQKKLERLEQEILQLETSLETDAEALMEASKTSSNEKIALLSKTMGDKKNKLDQLFKEHENLSSEIERSKRS